MASKSKKPTRPRKPVRRKLVTLTDSQRAILQPFIERAAETQIALAEAAERNATANTDVIRIVALMAPEAHRETARLNDDATEIYRLVPRS